MPRCVKDPCFDRNCEIAAHRRRETDEPDLAVVLARMSWWSIILPLAIAVVVIVPVVYLAIVGAPTSQP